MYPIHLPIPLAHASSMSFGTSTFGKDRLFSSAYPKTLVNSCKTNSSLLGFPLGRNQKCIVSGSCNEPVEVEPELKMPKHVTVIMDGSWRWAKSRGLSMIDGQRVAGKAFEQLILNCAKSGIKEEADSMWDLFSESIIPALTVKNEVRLSFIGRRDRLPQLLQEKMFHVEETTEGNKRMHLVMAMDYNGRYGRTEATKKIVTKVKDGVLQVEDVDDAVFEQHLATNVIDEFPNADLFTRTGGESRVSNFMMWQLAYTELFFTKKLFPDFDDTDLMEAVTAFQRRQRRFGGQK